MRLGIARLLGLVVLACALTLPGSARAFTFLDLGIHAGDPAGPLAAVIVQASDVGDAFQVSWNVDDPALSAEASFLVSSFSASEIVLDVTLSHTTSLADAGLTNAAVMSMGFGVTPSVVAELVAAGDVFDSVGSGSGPLQRFPGGFYLIDVCVFAAGCSGGAIHAGLAAGESDSFQVALSPRHFSFSHGAVLAFFPIKFQTSAGSFEPPGAVGDPGPAIPEPTSVLLYVGGVLVVAGSAGLRRRR
jgi:hypothetical protein